MFWIKRRRRRRSKDQLNSDIIDLANNYILEHTLYLDSTLNCNRVAKGIGTNRTYLWEALSSCGLGFQEYLSKFRIVFFIENARDFTRLSSSEIAERCGFSDAKHLGKYLKDMLGVGLPEYMRLLKKDADAT
jgi:YesN/AraC family two-component response regulator